MKVPCVLIIKKTAYSPADAIMNRLVKKPCIGDKPTFFAMIPNEKETGKVSHSYRNTIFDSFFKLHNLTPYFYAL